MNFSYMHVLSLTWQIIICTFPTDAFSRLAQRLMLPEMIRNIIHKVDFSVKHRNIILYLKLGALCYFDPHLSGCLASKLE